MQYDPSGKFEPRGEVRDWNGGKDWSPRLGMTASPPTTWHVLLSFLFIFIVIAA